MTTNGNLLFLNFVDPSKEALRAFRKSIRSHVAKDHYRKVARKKERDLSSHEKILTFNKPVVRAQNGRTLKHSRPLRCEQSFDNVPLEISQVSSSSPNNATQDDFVQMRKQELTRAISILEATEVPCQCTSTGPTMCRCCENIPLSWLLEDPTDKLDMCCRRLGESMSEVLYNLGGLVDVLGPELEQRMGLASGSTARFLMPLVLSDFALLALTALYCASMTKHLKGQSHHTTALLQLRGLAISYTEAALGDPNRVTSDQLLSAVSTLANHEVVYGSLTVYRLHWKGLLKMIAIRGGLNRLGREGYMKGRLLWQDANASKLAECSQFLDGSTCLTPAIEVDPSIFFSGVCPASDESDKTLSTSQGPCWIEPDFSKKCVHRSSQRISLYPSELANSSSALLASRIRPDELPSDIQNIKE